MSELLTHKTEYTRTPRTEFEDIWGELETAAVTFGTRGDKEIDSWEHSPAGKHIEYTVYGDPSAEAVRLSVNTPWRTIALMAAVRGDFIGKINLSAIQNLTFTMYPPHIVLEHDLPPVELLITSHDGQAAIADLNYEQFGEICKQSGVYEQQPLSRWKRLGNWVTTHLIKRSRALASDNQ